MSTHTNSIVFVGEVFDDAIEAMGFIKERHLINDKEYTEIKEKIISKHCSLEECLKKKFKQFPSSEPLNYLTGKGYFLGYIIAAYKTENDMVGFLDDIKVAQEKWNKIFNEDGTVFIKVQTS